MSRPNKIASHDMLFVDGRGRADPGPLTDKSDQRSLLAKLEDSWLGDVLGLAGLCAGIVGALFICWGVS